MPEVELYTTVKVNFMGVFFLEETYEKSVGDAVAEELEDKLGAELVYADMLTANTYIQELNCHCDYVNEVSELMKQPHQ